MKIRLIPSLASAFIVTSLCGVMYTAVQQNFRQSANDPQIQIAEDAAARLNDNASAVSVTNSARVAVETSLSPFTEVFDDTGKPIASNGYLLGKMPTLPAGVFAFAKVNGEDRFTWQPEPAVRDAVVIEHVTGKHPGFVMAARSLREVEVRENQLTIMISAGWLICMGIIVIAAVL